MDFKEDAFKKLYSALFGDTDSKVDESWDDIESGTDVKLMYTAAVRIHRLQGDLDEKQKTLDSVIVHQHADDVNFSFAEPTDQITRHRIDIGDFDYTFHVDAWGVRKGDTGQVRWFITHDEEYHPTYVANVLEKILLVMRDEIDTSKES